MSDRNSGNDKKRERFEAEALIHIDALHRTALRMTRNENEADDLVQETYLKAFRFWDKFEEGSNCRAWLFKILTNIFINDYRSKSRTPQVIELQGVDDDFLFDQLSALGPSENPEQLFFAKVFDDDVKKAIDNLPEEFRLVVILSFLEGFSYQEIAEIADLQIGTVKSKLHR
ncbi:MAG: sigma-70 family RNA polymerase sigma factor [candidate division Zixibacteria bacterium]|nr:sigma-70 family RNA polymerase sigma factor [candidate division Zixibacteria bacterium]